ncbi:MAG: peptidase M17, partial [Bacteroidales bacterium]
AANMTVGEHAGVYMGTAHAKYMQKMEDASLLVWEPFVKMPLWNMYNKQIESHIADVKNIGGPLAGAITAGKFLQKFVQYPWIHLDISGSAFFKQAYTYKGKGGTGFGVRSVYHFVKELL